MQSTTRRTQAAMGEARSSLGRSRTYSSGPILPSHKRRDDAAAEVALTGHLVRKMVRG